MPKHNSEETEKPLRKTNSSWNRPRFRNCKGCGNPCGIRNYCDRCRESTDVGVELYSRTDGRFDRLSKPASPTKNRSR